MHTNERKTVVYEYMDLLLKYTEKSAAKSDMTDDEFLKLRNQLKAKKS